MFPVAPGLPTDVSHLILDKCGLAYRLARLSRLSHAWRSTITLYVVRKTPTDVFHRHLLSILSTVNGCGLTTIEQLDSVHLRDQLQKEDTNRFASLCMLVQNFEYAPGNLHTTSRRTRLRDAFVELFTKRGVLRNFITWVRHQLAIRRLDNERPYVTLRIKHKRAQLEKTEQRLEAIDKKRVTLMEKKRKLDQKLGFEAEGLPE